MKRLITATDMVAVGLAVLLIWAAGDGNNLEVFSVILLIFSGMLLGVFVHKVARRYQVNTKAASKTKKK
jgi:hypothetical protein